MRQNLFLQITYRQGNAFAAYLHLDRRPGDKAARTERHGKWLIDYTEDNRAIGIEFPDVGAINLAELNRTLLANHQPPLETADLMPLQAA